MAEQARAYTSVGIAADQPVETDIAVGLAAVTPPAVCKAFAEPASVAPMVHAVAA